MKKYIILALLLAATPASAADDIHYHSVTEIRGDTIFVADNSPEGDSSLECNIEDGKCTDKNSSGSEITINGSTGYIKSPEGNTAATQQVLGMGTISTTYYSFYDIKTGIPSFIGLMTVSGGVSKTAFSQDGNAFVVVGGDGTVTTYILSSKTQSSIKVDQADLPFFHVSPSGLYISSYNYLKKAHRIWNTKTGSVVEPLGEPGVVEFSANEARAVFPIKQGGFRNLGIVSLPSGTPNGTVSGSFAVEDYNFAGNKLVYIANRQSPLSWGVFAENDNSPISEDASYGVVMQRIGDKLIYGRIEAKNTNLYVYDPDDGSSLKIDTEDDTTRPVLHRSEIKLGGNTAALIEPGSSDGTLFVWLHGGPQRQTSVDYHPYFSYAVYDDILERFAEAGSYVIKLDYPGSWGYGDAFQDELNGRVGTVEIDATIKAITEFANSHSIKNVYLIGNSYGGYMALRTLNEQPGLIDGVVSISGVGNWYELVQSIPSSPFATLFNGVPGIANNDLYMSASVYTNIDSIRTQPILVFYGTEDKTVPTRQSTEYAAFMEANDKNVKLIELPGEEHVLSQRSSLTKICETVADTFKLGDVDCR